MEEDVAVGNPMSPSEVLVSDGQATKLVDLVIARLRKSGLPHPACQYVLENEGAAIADVVEADFRRRVEARLRAIEPHILERLPFDPLSFLGRGWEIAERVGARTGGNLNAGQIARRDYLREGEPYITGEERLTRIKAAQNVQLDAEDFMALWQEEGYVTLRWLYDTKGITWLSFWGTILRAPDGVRSVLYLYRYDDGSWGWYCSWLDGDWGDDYPAAVLASN